MIKFSKMHGAGNDFVLMMHKDVCNYEYSWLARQMCDRHFGIGADGIMVVEKSDIADVKMFYYNSDGSIGEMCGNGIRCFARFVYDNHIVRKKNLYIETLAGIKIAEVITNKDDEVEAIRINMGKPVVNPSDVPINVEGDSAIDRELSVNGENIRYSTILVGVPHTVIFKERITEDYIRDIGPRIETMDIFPKKTNVNFALVKDRSHMNVETWERGAGRTLACGTGVCSCVYVANLLDKVDKEVEVTVAGGKLVITLDENGDIYMQGPAKLICSGEYWF